MIPEKIGCFGLSALLLSVPAAAAFSLNTPYDNRFTDLPENSWYRSYAVTAYTYGLMQGTDSEHFSPSGIISWGEAAAAAVRVYALSRGEENSLTAEDSQPWYAFYLDKAQAYDLLPSVDAAGDSEITRKDFAYMIDAALPEEEKQSANDIPEGSIPDVDLDGSYYDAVYRLYRAGILNGSDSQKSFSPERTLTRAEAAAILSRVAVPSLRVSQAEEPASPGLPDAQPGLRTLRNLLATAMQPVGRTMYVWGGGWNEEDTGAGEEAVSLGVSPAWEEFFRKQTAGYDYRQTRYQIHDGLDCSGYLGWTVYNTLQKQEGLAGYVVLSTQMAQNYANRGWGTYTPASKVQDYRAGDVMSMSGHVLLCLGTCADGSVLFVHASPPGVSLCGTAKSDGSESQAVSLARTYMNRYFPAWCQKYQSFQRSAQYLAQASQMRWNSATLSDPDGCLSLTPEQLLQNLFGEN